MSGNTPPAAQEAPAAATGRSRLVKYIGTADIARLPVGENFSGRLAEPLKKEVQFDWGNDHVVDCHKAGMSAEAIELLLEDKARFVDVTGKKVRPVGANERLWRGVRETKVAIKDDEASA